MPAFIDLTGRTCGKWEVLRRAAKKGSGAYWICRCACGRRQSVRGVTLTRPVDPSTQCRACGNTGKKGKPPAYRPGDKVGNWTIKSGPRRVDRRYVGECECGAVQILCVGNLRKGASTQCRACATAGINERDGHGAKALAAHRVKKRSPAAVGFHTNEETMMSAEEIAAGIAEIEAALGDYLCSPDNPTGAVVTYNPDRASPWEIRDDFCWEEYADLVEAVDSAEVWCESMTG